MKGFPVDKLTRLIPLTQGKVAIVDAADYEWLLQWKWRTMRARIGGWYAVRSYLKEPHVKRTQCMHRLLLDAPAGLHVDHRDGDGLNNRRSNIRLATIAQNQHNRGPATRNTSGCKGVTWDKQGKKWQAQIEVNRKNIYLGRFLDKLDAAKAYAAAAAKFHGEFARTEAFKKESQGVTP